MSDEQQAKKGRCKQLIWTTAIVALALFAGAIALVYAELEKKARYQQSLSHCRQLVAALRLYAGDHNGAYPDADASQPKTANRAFRLLIREGMLDDERIFGAKNSPFYPDGDVGDPPHYLKALEPGENHWAMTKSAPEESTLPFPLVFENAVTNTWPPHWNTDTVGKKEPGRTWRGGKILVGFSDSSVQAIQLESTHGTSVPPKRDADGKDVFTRAAEKMEILDIER